jgi:hypothetical protein
LVSDFQGLGLKYWTMFADDVFEVAVRAKLKDHYNVVLGEEAVIYSGGEETVRVCGLG